MFLTRNYSYNYLINNAFYEKIRSGWIAVPHPARGATSFKHLADHDNWCILADLQHIYTK